MDILGFGGDEGGGDAAVKRQAEGFANPMYQLANLMGQVRQKKAGAEYQVTLMLMKMLLVVGLVLETDFATPTLE